KNEEEFESKFLVLEEQISKDFLNKLSDPQFPEELKALEQPEMQYTLNQLTKINVGYIAVINQAEILFEKTSHELKNKENQKKILNHYLKLIF
ncbi:MAG: hypothetical protein ACKOAD_05105, partial [Gammaproteobacteria bacterium]